MASNTISITFKLEGDDKTFKQLATDADGLKRAMSGVISEAGQLKGSVINFAALATGIDAAQRSFTQLQSSMQDLANAYAVQETAERKLETVMQQRMGATDAEIQSIKELASAQQEIGVIGDEVQLSGAQQVATFLKEKSSLDTLIPAMNNLLVQQKGLSATTGDAVGVANLMGKAMQGQTSALTRVGITFSEAQANVMKYGTESERAAMLAQIITDNVGNMNQELAQTESGKQQQLANTLGDVKEQIGGLVNGALPFVTIAAQASQALAAVSTLVAGIKTLTVTMYASTKAFVVSTAAFIKNKVATLAVASAQRVVKVATAAWVGIQRVLNLVLSANPIGLIITAIGALVAAIVYAYNNCESFRKIVNQVWDAIKPLAIAIMDGLAKAFEWLVEKCKEAWEWLKNILGLGGKKVEVAVSVSKPKATPGMNLGELEAKYAGYKPGASALKTPEAAKVSAPKSDATKVWSDNARTLEAIETNIDILQEKLQKAGIDEAAIINQQIAAWQKKADAIRDAGLAVTEEAQRVDTGATTLQGIEKNISILQGELNKATESSAVSINKEITAWEKKANAIRNAGKEIENTKPIWTDNPGTFKEIGDNIQILQKKLGDAKSIEDAAGINKQIAALNNLAEAYRSAGLSATDASDYVSQVGSVMSTMSSILGEAGGSWLTWSANICQSISQALPAMRSMFTALQAIATGSAMAENSKMGPFGWISGIAAVASVIATFASIPKFADGGIVSGPTVGLIGEYAGASNNPEVVAPLDKLRSMMTPAGEPVIIGGTLRASGREIVCVLANETRIASKSGKRTNIKI